MKLVLASSSPYRKAQLATLHLPFESTSPAIDESPLPNEAPETVAIRLAVTKARAVCQMHPGSLIIGSDQVACSEGILLGKPGTRDKAVAQLRWLQGKQVMFYSAIALLNSENGDLQQHTTKTLVHYKALTDNEIDCYLDYDKPYDCAGSFKIESLGIALLSSVESNDPTALVGLPLIALTAMLVNAGMNPLR